jgi:hypothetical protein
MAGADGGGQLAQAEVVDAMRGDVGDGGLEQELARIGPGGPADAVACSAYHLVQLVYHTVQIE